MKSLLICIHCGGLPFDSETVYEKSLGGSETAAFYLAKELNELGHEVIVFTNKEDPISREGGPRFIYQGQASEREPLGSTFHFWATNTPHDVLIVQRNPHAFKFQYASKLNLLWLHDLALYRDAQAVNDALWNINGVLCVSQFHKEQVAKGYRIPLDMIHVLNNGVDPEMFKEAPKKQLDTKVNLLYVSRPERGLEHLVKSGGIMDQVKERGYDYHLYVCCYNNVAAHMKDYYTMLWQRIQGMSNATQLGFLKKKDLYGFMKACDLLVYPTPSTVQPDFVEVSCIAAMEAMHAGLPMLTTEKGALPETCKDSGTMFSGIEGFADKIVTMFEYEDAHGAHKIMKRKQVTASNRYTWKSSTKSLCGLVESLSAEQCEKMSSGTYLTNAINHSAISSVAAPTPCADSEEDSIYIRKIAELKECYSFYPLSSYAEHYKNYYEYEKARGVDYGPERMEGNSRFEVVSSVVEKHAKEQAFPLVMDYGCAHGHYTVTLAKRFPDCQFVGVDICESNVIKARKWAADEGLSNVFFEVGDFSNETPTDDIYKDLSVTLIIAAEVLEHVRDPFETFLNLSSLEPRQFVITTPFGPWEAEGYKEHWPWRAHVHNFTRSVIKSAFGCYEGFNLQCVPSGMSRLGEVLGSYVYSFNNHQAFTGPELSNDLFLGDRPVDFIGMRETLALVMLTMEDDWKSIVRCLDSVRGVVDEVVVSLDIKNGSETITQVLIQFCEEERVPLHIVQCPDPLKEGFAAARNAALEKVSADWVLWLDSDEVLVYKDNIRKYLKANSLDGYSIPQNHISDDPPGLMTTDYPSKLFRNKKGFEFYGKVHEHPEKGRGAGPGNVQVIKDVSITHLGYGTEATRRKRFFRNLDLLVKDTDSYESRDLNKFFMVRDMAQLLMYQHEVGRQLTSMSDQDIVSAGHRAWKDCLASENLRMILEAAKFYSKLVEISYPSPIKVVLKLGMSKQVAGAENELEVALTTKDAVAQFTSLITKLQLDQIPDEYI